MLGLSRDKLAQFSIFQAFLAVLLVPALSAAAPTIKQEFPRLGLMLIGGDGHRYQDADYQRQLSRFDFVILNMWPGWEKGGQGSTPNEKQSYVLRQIRALNPGIILANYSMVLESPDRLTNAHSDVWNKVRSEVGPTGNGGTTTPNDWWVRTKNGEKASPWPGTWKINITSHVTPDADKRTYPEWYARRNYDRMFKNVPEWDGIFHDTARFKPRVTVDWDRDGVDDSPDDWSTQVSYRAGHLRQWQTERQLMPDMLLFGSIGSWGVSVVGDYGKWVLDEFHNALDGGYLERYMGKSWSMEKNRGWEKMRRAYGVAMAHTAYPKLVVFNVANDDRDGAGYYQFFRYGFATALMDDGYYDFSDPDAYNDIYWFDEYDLAGNATTSWLGKAIDAPQNSPWQKGVYRRRFANGMALVNPRGNGTQTVQLEPGYSFIRGNQDPTVNTGKPAQSVTLIERDGILLVKGTLENVKPPKPPQMSAN
jgi:putative glycosyl hydrolase-like family 15 (GHL15) protein